MDEKTYMNNQVKKQFNNAANRYDRYALIQRQMGEKLVTVAKQKGEFKHILEVGCGTGNVTRQLLDYFPHAKIHAIDISPEMVKMAREKCGAECRLSLSVCDVEDDYAPFNEEYYDCIISNAAFQWFKQPQATLMKLAKQLKSNGWILMATFGVKTFAELQATFVQVEQQLQLPPQIHQLPMVSLRELQRFFDGAGLNINKQEENMHRFWYANSREFLYAVKSVGAGYSQNQLSLGKTNQLMKRVLRRYDEYYRRETGQVYATYHTLHVHAQK